VNDYKIGDMRIYIKTTLNSEKIPWNYQPKLVGCLHKWLGENTVHDQMSLYSLSWLSGKFKSSREGINFKESPQFFISAYDPNLIKSVIKGIQEDPIMFSGLQVSEIRLLQPPAFRSEEYFHVQSPVLIKRTISHGETKFYFPNDSESDKLLTHTMENKLRKAGLEHLKIDISFDKSYRNPQSKLVELNGMKNKATICPVRISGDPEAISFAWLVGIGNSTGSGFGALK
jgi:CRISPR-associated endoribonuclease Cas6